MRRAKKEKQKEQKLNLVPIMDSVFILIFFLLFSTKFIEMYEINADTPVVKEVPDDQEPEKNPLNLILKLSGSDITITTGLDEKVHSTYKKVKDGDFDYKKINLVIAKIRMRKKKEQTVVVRSKKNVKYKTIVRLMDTVKDWPETMDDQGNEIGREVSSEKEAGAKETYKAKKKMFQNIVLESF